MNVQQSLVLGVIQGLTEFLPVSSTAHLILAPEFFRVPKPTYPHTYDTIIQIGTLLPVLVYFWREWLRLLQASARIVRARRVTTDPDERMVKYLVMGTIPAVVIGLLFESRIEILAEPDRFRPAYLCIGGALIVVGVLMWWIESASRKDRTLDKLRAPDAWLIGIAQALALFPGVSRSGSTIVAGLFAGFTREAAARFSFLLMTPVMIAGVAYKSIKLITGTEQMPAEEWMSMLLATLVAAITGYLAIAFLLSWLRKRSLWGFAVYRILAGSFLILFYFRQ